MARGAWRTLAAEGAVEGWLVVDIDVYVLVSPKLPFVCGRVCVVRRAELRFCGLRRSDIVSVGSKAWLLLLAILLSLLESRKQRRLALYLHYQDAALEMQDSDQK